MSLTVTTSDLRPTDPELVATVADLVPRLRELAPVGEQRRWLDDESVALLGDAGLWRATVPKRFGGLDLPLADQIELLTHVGRADGSLAWVATLWLANAWVATLFPDAAQEEIFAEGDTRVSGIFQPTGTLTPTSGGYLLSGSWKWNTGCRGAQWDGLGALLATGDGPPEVYYCMIPASELTIEDDWHAFAASSTGSSEVRVADVFVPAHRVIPMAQAIDGTTGDRSNAGATGRNYPFFGMIMGNALGAFLGMAEGAYELFLRRLPGRGITYTPWTDQSASPVTHIQVATAANEIDAAKALTVHVVDVLQEAADRGVLPPIAQRAALRGNCAYIAELCRQAVQQLYQASGASVIMRDVPFQRVYRDIQGLSQHAAMALNSNLEVHGRVEVGLDPATPFI
ncbi:MAG TPA: acyl-CoA dehydrogenase family protein [Trebonia sp.]|nr:acyl-CoA dehydrogenase family protein [Trebonia sp.]